ncbi:hypothetical protein IJG14_02210 [bacterium]|nr:hypothetical protein [bacterium]
MSLLSKYYHRRYMLRKLSEESHDKGLNNIKNEVNRVRSMLGTLNETYASAASGFFASAGEIVPQMESSW